VPELPEIRLRPLLRRLGAAQVDFVAVGGAAVIGHGYARTTKDLDIVYATDDENLIRLGSVLTQLNARLSGIDEDIPFVADARTIRRTTILTLDTDEGRIDLLFRPWGAPPYEEMRARAEVVDLDGVEVRIASLEDLMAMKRAAGRPQDLADLEKLEAILRLRAD